jgi:urease alpha subunit
VDGVLVDKQIDDGLIVAWQGITLADIKIFEESMPRIGQDGAKKNHKD